MVYCYSAAIGFVDGVIRIYKTTDGGIPWDEAAVVDSVYLGLTCFPERALGYGMNYSEFYRLKG
jgi:hypothetical protein